MNTYRVIVTDLVLPALASHTGVTYTSVPQPREDAPELARVVLGLPRLRDERGPWRHPRPGGQRTVRLEPAP